MTEKTLALAPSPPNFADALDAAAEGFADGLSDDIGKALADPIFRLLIAAKGIEAPQVAESIRHLADRLKPHPPRAAPLALLVSELFYSKKPAR